MGPHSLLLYFLVPLTFAAPSFECGTSWWINISLLCLLPWFYDLLVPLVLFTWPGAIGIMNLTTPAPERTIILYQVQV